MNRGYFKTCGNESCVNTVRSTNISKTMDDKYGMHASKLQTTKNKTKITLANRYGDPDYVNTEGRIKTMVERYGVEHALKSEDFLHKKRNTQFDRYGDKNYTNRSDSEKTNLELRGVRNVSQDPIVRAKTRTSFSRNHIDRLNNRLDSIGIQIISSESNRYEYLCTCGTIHSMSNSQFNVYVRSGESPCPSCNPYNPSYRSTGESELVEYISSIYTGPIICNHRKFGIELDIFLPELKLAFEYNGLYWHNELFKSPEYHLSKKMKAAEIGVDLIHIFEDEWSLHKDIVKSRVSSMLGIVKRLFARKCVIRDVPLHDAKQFLSENHLQGYVGSSIRIGLYHDNVLVSVMTFGRPRFDKKAGPTDLELLRFCSLRNTVVIGGASRLMQYVVNRYPDVSRIVTETNRCWSSGSSSVYEQIGFTFTHNTVPGYWYVVAGSRVHRFNYRLSRLKSMGWFDEHVNMSDTEPTARNIMLTRKIYRIYDCGNSVYEWLRV